MVTARYTRDEIMAMLAVVPDPEIPVLSINEMGMLRDVIVDESGYTVLLTPTYTGCPAMETIRQDVISTLEGNGVGGVTVEMIYSPAWTTDWMSDSAKDKMRAYGIAPPLRSMTCNKEGLHGRQVCCPMCNSLDTVLVSRFGSTACKALYSCNNCKEPFEYFKCH